MNTRSLLVIVLSLAALVWISALSLTNTPHVVMYAAGQTSSNITATNINATTTRSEEEESTNATSTVVRDSLFAYMDGRVLPPNDFIHLYDTTPYMIMDGHVAAKLACNEQSQTPFQILIGQAPNMTSAQLELVAELSRPGQICLYHADLHSAHGDDPQGSAEGRAITDNEIMPLEAGHEQGAGEGGEITEEEHTH